MPKLKTHQSTSKRFRITATGKVMHTKVGKSHLRRRKSKRSAGFANRPQVGQPVQSILALLQAQFVAQHARLGLLGSAKTPALITDDRLDGGQQLGRRHQGDRDSRAFENSFDDLAVAVVGNDGAVFDGVSADDAAGRHVHIENGIAG